MKRVSKNSRGCWIWLGAWDKDGYGEVYLGGRKYRSHRASWKIFNGEIPKGMLVLHKCDVPSCVNPRHLYIGTPKDNMSDKMKRGRFRTGVGVKQPSAKLTDVIVKEIRKKYENGMFQRIIAKEYGVSQSVVSTVINNKAWRHV